MLTVVGGIGNVAGALMGGILAGTAFTALTSTFQNLSTDHGGVASGASWPTCRWWLRRSSGSASAATPAGPCPTSWRAYRPLWRVKGVLAAGVLAEVVAYLLVLTNVMGNWWLVLATGVIALVAAGDRPRRAARGLPRQPPVSTRDRRTHRGAVTVPVDGLAAVEGVADVRP